MQRISCLLTSRQKKALNLTAITEASNEQLKKELLKFFETIESLQEETYELAWNNGWYVLEESEKTKINQKAKELQKKLDELSQ